MSNGVVELYPKPSKDVRIPPVLSKPQRFASGFPDERRSSLRSWAGFPTVPRSTICRQVVPRVQELGEGSRVCRFGHFRVCGFDYVEAWGFGIILKTASNLNCRRLSSGRLKSLVCCLGFSQRLYIVVCCHHDSCCDELQGYSC